MNSIQLRAFELYYSGKSINFIRSELHKSENTIVKWVSKYNFAQMAADRTAKIMAQTTQDMLAVRQDIITVVKNSIKKTVTQQNVFGDVVSSVNIENAKDLESLAKIITSFDGSSVQPAVQVNVNEPKTVDVSDDVLRELGRKIVEEGD